MHTGLKSLFLHKRTAQGYTLTETLIALLIFSLLTYQAFSSLSFFNVLQETRIRSENDSRCFEKIHLYFQKQIESSSKICIKDGRVFLQDMETPKYYNDYQLKSNGMLYRIKIAANLKPISGGASSQFEKGIQSFNLAPETDEGGALTDIFLLQVVFIEEKEKCYETYITYPGGTENILLY